MAQVVERELAADGVESNGYAVLSLIGVRGTVRLTELAAEYDATPAQLALAWLLHHSPAITPIPGTSDRKHLRENLAALHIDLTPEDMAEIEAAAGQGHA